MKKLALLLTALAALLNTAPSVAAAVAVGDELPALTLDDQTGKAHTVDTSVRRIYANGDRKGDALMKEAMTGADQSALDNQKAVVIAEISAAPFFVKSIIRGSLKDRRYTTLLDTKGDTQKILPYKADRIAVIELSQGRVKALRYVGDAAELRKEMGLPPPAPVKEE